MTTRANIDAGLSELLALVGGGKTPQPVEQVSTQAQQPTEYVPLADRLAAQRQALAAQAQSEQEQPETDSLPADEVVNGENAMALLTIAFRLFRNLFAKPLEQLGQVWDRNQGQPWRGLCTDLVHSAGKDQLCQVGEETLSPTGEACLVFWANLLVREAERDGRIGLTDLHHAVSQTLEATLNNTLRAIHTSGPAAATATAGPEVSWLGGRQLTDILPADQVEQLYCEARDMMTVQQRRATTEWLKAGSRTSGELLASLCFDWLLQHYLTDHQEQLQGRQLPAAVYNSISERSGEVRQRCTTLVTSLSTDGELPTATRLLGSLRTEYPRYCRFVDDLLRVALQEEAQPTANTSIDREEQATNDAYNRARRGFGGRIAYRDQTLTWLRDRRRTWRELLERMAGDYWVGLQIEQHGRTPIAPESWGLINNLAIELIEPFIGPEGQLPEPRVLLETWETAFPEFQQLIGFGQQQQAETMASGDPQPQPEEEAAGDVIAQQRIVTRETLAEFYLPNRPNEIDDTVVETWRRACVPPDEAATPDEIDAWRTRLYQETSPEIQERVQAIIAYLQSDDGQALLTERSWQMKGDKQTFISILSLAMRFFVYGYTLGETPARTREAITERNELADCLAS